ncbi:hypothetical protein BDN72DRAFT_830826 [Pluteus cervinus]|uniref:Uncharacterized protein n=1 Tax=Pluteus cervinus TaxID=181527 RepID=A0ACD3BFB5_9AGAR|nr:hypothetical protein BDN72DRAFT_830826 [Pluteus cervinus]
MATIPPRTANRDIQGHSTEILVQTFADRIMVLVTQLGKVGNLIQATLPSTVPLNPVSSESDPLDYKNVQLPEPPAAVQLMPLLGSASSEHTRALQSLYASQIATILWTFESLGPLVVARRPVIVGIALRNSKVEGDEAERATFLEVMKVLSELILQT